MPSINTNISAMTALQSLNKTNAALDTTQKRISTGYRVGSAEDNAAYWSIATTMRSDNSALSTVKDALGLGAATIDVAYTAMNTAIDVTKEIKNKLVAARQPGVDRTKIQAEITELQNQLTVIGNSAVLLRPELAVGRFVGGRLQRLEVDCRIVHPLGLERVDRHDQRQHCQRQAVSTRALHAVGIVDGLRDATTGAISGTGTFSVCCPVDLGPDRQRHRPDDA